MQRFGELRVLPLTSRFATISRTTENASAAVAEAIRVATAIEERRLRAYGVDDATIEAEIVAFSHVLHRSIAERVSAQPRMTPNNLKGA